MAASYIKMPALRRCYSSAGDHDSHSMGSESTFSEVAFKLPELEAVDGNLLTEEEEFEIKKYHSKSKLEYSDRKEKQLYKSIDQKRFSSLSLDSYSHSAKSPSKSPSFAAGMLVIPVQGGSVLNNKRVFAQSKKETNLVKNVILRKPGEVKDKLGALNMTSFLDADDHSDNSLQRGLFETPTLGSVQEKREDLREEEIEWYCRKHGKKAAAKYTNEEKRKLRKWFQELDYDGSGEVSVEELQDPLLSAGILRTREQVVRVLANVDKNNTMGIDFDEFLLALNDNKIADAKKLKKLQEMSNNVNGFSMDTQITAERRKTIYKSVVTKCDKRSKQMDALIKKYLDKPRFTVKDRERISQEIEILDEKQSKSNYLHAKYITALDGVLQAKNEFYKMKELDRVYKEESAQQDLMGSSTACVNEMMVKSRFPTGFLNPEGANRLLDLSVKQAHVSEKQAEVRRAVSRGEARASALSAQDDDKQENEVADAARNSYNQFSAYSPVKTKRSQVL